MKKKTKAKAKTKSKASNLPKREKPSFGVPELAKELKIGELHTRNKLRAAKVGKVNGIYDFKNVAGVKATAKKLAA